MDLQKNFDQFFSHSARFTIFIPIVVIVLALGFKAYKVIHPQNASSQS